MVDPFDIDSVLKTIREQAAAEDLRLTRHAQQEMAEEEITLGEVLDAIGTARILENYPQHRRGPCCLLHGTTATGRDLHIVCTTCQPVLVIITVYEPKPPKWVTPIQRSQ